MAHLTLAQRRAIAANRRRILAREAALAAALDAVWRQAQASITPAQAALIAAYTRALDTLTGTPDDGTEDDLPHEAPRVPPTWAKENGHLSQLERAVLLAVASFATASVLHITDGQQTAARAGAVDAQALLRAALEPLAARLDLRVVDSLIHHPPQGVLDALIGRSHTAGTTLDALFGRLDSATAERVLKALHAALAAGSHPTVAARMITDATGMARNRALVIARTEMLNAYRTASLAQFRASKDVVRGWTWVAAGDACPFCASMNGTEHTLDEDLSAMTHPNCRCAMAPLTKPLDDILSMFAA